MKTVVDAKAVGFMSGKVVARLDLQVSTASELPAEGGTVENYIVAVPSTAQIIQLGKFATLDEDGNWYEAGTGEVVETGGGEG